MVVVVVVVTGAAVTGVVGTLVVVGAGGGSGSGGAWDWAMTAENPAIALTTSSGGRSMASTCLASLSRPEATRAAA